MRKSHHAIIYTEDANRPGVPPLLAGEGATRGTDGIDALRPRAILVDPAHRSHKLDPASRLNYGKIYQIYYACETYLFGRVAQQSQADFMQTQAGPSHRRQDSHHESDTDAAYNVLQSAAANYGVSIPPLDAGWAEYYLNNREAFRDYVRRLLWGKDPRAYDALVRNETDYMRRVADARAAANARSSAEPRRVADPSRLTDTRRPADSRGTTGSRRSLETRRTDTRRLTSRRADTYSRSGRRRDSDNDGDDDDGDDRDDDDDDDDEEDRNQ